MTAPTPAGQARAERIEADLIERVARVLAEVNRDGCFDPANFTEAEWANGDLDEDRDFYRRMVAAAVEVLRGETR